MIDKAEKALNSDEVAAEEKEEIKDALDVFKSFVDKYIVCDAEGNVIENNLPLSDSTVMSEYTNLFNALSKLVDDDSGSDWITLLFELIAMVISLIISFVKYIRS